MNATEIQMLIDNVGANGGVVTLPKGTHYIDQPLHIENSGGGYGRGIALIGQSAGARSAGATRLIWNGVAYKSMLYLKSRDCTIAGIHFEVAPGSLLKAAVSIDQGLGGRATTNNLFAECRFLGALDGELAVGQLDHGVIIGDENPNASNLDFMTFESCEFRGARVSAIDIASRTGQSKQHLIQRCWFTSPGPQKGAAIVTKSGSFNTVACAFNGFARAIYTESPTDRLSIRDSYVEGCKRFLDTSKGGASTKKMWPVLIDGGVFNYQVGPQAPFGDGSPYGGEYLLYTHNGILDVRNCIFGDGATYDQQFKIIAGREAIVVSYGNVFPNDQPYGPMIHQLQSIACKGLNAAGDKVVLA